MAEQPQAPKKRLGRKAILLLAAAALVGCCALAALASALNGPSGQATAVDASTRAAASSGTAQTVPDTATALPVKPGSLALGWGEIRLDSVQFRDQVLWKGSLAKPENGTWIAVFFTATNTGPTDQTILSSHLALLLDGTEYKPDGDASGGLGLSEGIPHTPVGSGLKVPSGQIVSSVVVFDCPTQFISAEFRYKTASSSLPAIVTPTATLTPTVTSTPLPTATPTIGPTSTATPTRAPTATPEPTLTPTQSPVPAATPDISPTARAFYDDVLVLFEEAEKADTNVQEYTEYMAGGGPYDPLELYERAKLAAETWEQVKFSMYSLQPEHPTLRDAAESFGLSASFKEDAYRTLLRWVDSQTTADLATYREQMNDAESALLAGLAYIAELGGLPTPTP